MKKYYKLLSFCLLSLFVSCERLETLDIPEFDVYVEKNTFKLGEDVVFHFRGHPDVITMYTGDIGNDVQFTDGRYMNSSIKAHFDMQMLDGLQEDQVDILLSLDFDGDYSIEGVNRATWQSVADRFELLKPRETRVYQSSGWADFTSFLGNEEEAHFYVAVRYKTRNQIEYGVGNLTRLREFTIHAENSLSNQVLENHGSLDWQLFSTANKENDRAAVLGNLVELRSNRVNNGYDEETEDWVVSKKISFERYTYVGPDWGLAIKGVSSKRVDSYTHIYDIPGTHKVTFVAKNINRDNVKEVVKQIEINIEP